MTDLASLVGLTRSLAIYYGRPWRIGRIARFYKAFVEPGDLAFDIGAHVGNRSLALTRAGARVVALEPQDLFCRFLCRTMPSTVTVLPLAAGPAAALGTMRVSRRHPTVSTVASGFADAVGTSKGFASVAWDGAQQVEITTLDRLVARFGQPAFVKIDVEGFEDQVLAGLSHPVRTVAFEYLPAALAPAYACLDRLERLGEYRFNLVRGEELAFRTPDWMTSRDIRILLSGLGPDDRSGDIYARLR